MLLDTRWTKAERLAYDRELRRGHFAACVAILEAKMTPEERERAHQKSEELKSIFLLPQTAQEQP